VRDQSLPKPPWEGFESIKRQKGGKTDQAQQSLPHVRWYLQHQDGHVVTCQPKAWMDTGGFAMYIDLVLGPWWQLKRKSPSDRMLLVCDNASVHTAPELQQKLDEHGILLRFLPPNMTQWLQPLDLVVCGLIKIVQRARRGGLMATHLRQWRDERDRVVGRAVSLGN
jgi:hypothetical protein